MPNLRFALRTLFKSPFVTLVAIVSLALGIGANAAIFSLFNQMLLRTLPVAEPDRLVNLVATWPKPGSQYCSTSGDCDAVLSYPMLRDLENSPLTGMSFYVRAASDSNQLVAAIPKVVAGLDANLPVENIKTMPEQVRDNVFLDRFISVMSASFAILATLLAAVGLYGVLAYTVAKRTREIGLRMALGASPKRVRGMVLRQVAMMTLVGGAVGLAAAVAVGRLAESRLYQLKGWDPTVLVSAAVALGLVAIGADLIPASRASRIDPMLALRYK